MVAKVVYQRTSDTVFFLIRCRQFFIDPYREIANRSEHARFEVERWFLVHDIAQHVLVLEVGVRYHLVGKKERPVRYERHKHYKREHYAEKGDTCGFKCRKFAVFRQVSESHYRGQEYGHRQSHGNHGCAHVHHHLGDGQNTDSLAYYIVRIEPQYLQYKHQQHHEKRGEKRQ